MSQANAIYSSGQQCPELVVDGSPESGDGIPARERWEARGAAANLIVAARHIEAQVGPRVTAAHTTVIS